MTTRWVVGVCALEFEPARPVFFVVERRDAVTLERIIRHTCLPGTTIITDCWRGYAGLSNLGFNHITVNHSRHFVDPLTGWLFIVAGEGNFIIIRRY